MLIFIDADDFDILYVKFYALRVFSFARASIFASSRKDLMYALRGVPPPIYTHAARVDAGQKLGADSGFASFKASLFP